MTTWQLVILRLYLLTLGRTAAGAAWLRRFLVRRLIADRNAGRYTASARFFSLRELK